LEPVPPETSVAADLTGRRVVVVDDNRDAATSLATMLSLLGADVVVAYDGLESVAMAEAHDPDIIFLDIGMPGLDGLEVARRIRSGPLGQQVRLVAVTGRSQPHDREAALTAGFDVYLTKPATAEQIRMACGSHGKGTRSVPGTDSVNEPTR
jgi:CheY-like chemotaxis protein